MSRWQEQACAPSTTALVTSLEDTPRHVGELCPPRGDRLGIHIRSHQKTKIHCSPWDTLPACTGIPGGTLGRCQAFLPPDPCRSSHPEAGVRVSSESWKKPAHALSCSTDGTQTRRWQALPGATHQAVWLESPVLTTELCYCPEAGPSRLEEGRQGTQGAKGTCAGSLELLTLLVLACDPSWAALIPMILQVIIYLGPGHVQPSLHPFTRLQGPAAQFSPGSQICGPHIPAACDGKG